MTREDDDVPDDYDQAADNMREVAIAAEILGCTAEQAARALRAFADEFHPEKLMHDIASSWAPADRIELQQRVRAAMIDHPEQSMVEHMLEQAVAMEESRPR